VKTLALIDVKPDVQTGLINLSRDTEISIPMPLIVGFVLGLVVAKLFS
jgi:hypothetical protein